MYEGVSGHSLISFSFSCGQKRRPITKVVYNLLSERDLRKRMKEAGLSTHGTKQQLIRRHQEYVQMYNSQCDSLNPQSGMAGPAFH